MYNHLNDYFDGVVLTAGRKNTFIVALVLTYQIKAENIFIIDHSKLNCDNASALIPPKNIEWVH